MSDEFEFQRQSGEIDQLMAAMNRAQLAMVPAKKDATNPFFHSKYADLPAVWDALHSFRVEGIVATQSPMEGPDGYIVLETQLTHTSGQWMRSRLKMRVGKDDPQGYGSAITYARRYALGAMTGLVTEEDDDGNAASPQPTTKNFAQKFPEQAKAIAEKMNTPIDAAVPRGGQRSQEPGPANDNVKSGVQDAPASLLPGLDVGAYLLQFPKELKGQRVGDVTDVQLTWLAKYYNEKLSAPANAQSPYRQEWEAILKEVWAVQLHPSRLNQVPA
jgi:hypothetical protein